MNLSKEQQEKLSNKINEVLKKPGCEVCDSPNWGTMDRLYEIREFDKGAILMGGGIIPLAVIQCRNCGYMRLLNAITIGFVNGDTGEIIDG